MPTRPSVKRRQIFIRGLRGECPRCQTRDLFSSHLRLKNACPHCGLPLEAESGWGLGAIPINYGLTCMIWVVPVGLACAAGLLSFAQGALSAGAGALVLPLFLHRLALKTWVGLYYACLPGELGEPPENEPPTKD